MGLHVCNPRTKQRVPLRGVTGTAAVPTWGRMSTHACCRDANACMHTDVLPPYHTSIVVVLVCHSCQCHPAVMTNPSMCEYRQTGFSRTTPHRLAVLEALSGSRLTTLAVSGGVPLSGRVAAALASAFPSMADVYLGFHWEENDMPPGGADSPEAAEYYRGAEQLLALCGPRLHSLQLVSSVQQWPPSAFRALSHCTALAHLQLEAGRRDAEGRPPVPPYLGTSSTVPLVAFFLLSSAPVR